MMRLVIPHLYKEAEVRRRDDCVEVDFRSLPCRGQAPSERGWVLPEALARELLAGLRKVFED